MSKNQAVIVKSFMRASIFLILINTTTTTTTEPPAPPNHILFASDLFAVITEGKSAENIVYSPASIQTCMALVFIAAEGDTAKEIRDALHLGEGDKIYVAEIFGNFLKVNAKSSNITYEVPILKIISRLYVNDQLNISEKFHKIALEYFDTQTELLDFNDSKIAVDHMNQWVAQQTANKIRDILKADTVNSDTNAIILNAIYFKAKWLNAFSESSTSISEFYLNLNDSSTVEFMYNEEYYGYAELPELKATALEMPYNNSDISMLIVLPNETEGLQTLELRLRNENLNEIIKQISLRKVHAYVPKFNIEFDFDLKEPLQKLGLLTTFTSSANFEGLFSTSRYQSISEIRHKAFLNVNEAGSEAAATTFTTLTTLSANFDEPVFRADHPFVFFIRSKSAVYFAGHVATI